MTRPEILLLALVLDAVAGDPAWLWARVPHPVVLAGRAAGALERAWNRGGDSRRRGLGGVAVLVVVGAAAGAAWGIARALAPLPGPLPGIAEAVLAFTLVAQRDLYDHVAAVAAPLARGDTAAARAAVGRVCGRDPARLDDAGVARAAVETTAENFADGVAAPVFFFALAGLPGMAAYKALNTCDSMLGHRDARHRAFGLAAARLDDLANLIPARLAALLLAAAAGRRGPRALRTAWRDGGAHRSPNAGWPEAAMAGALGVALAGPRHYAGHTADDPWLNETGEQAGAAHARAALGVLVRACGILAAVVAGWAVALRFP